ncbi:response regulator transcription factor [Alkalicoccus urumqiensis]|uniref:HTH luxR-type domain-containing protein n=1 Tax=Alkalicoccus urumqiensis TaxID=1548213 RepID=A0A2P6MEF7_ALKUR|nr:LuxR C-terminal-related transcriptional regulator [Alkalicoccus urumqiensis]PRO64663.1 hypothetical protein C6I21_13225 [Alkalicoccus urumqiensis]
MRILAAVHHELVRYGLMQVVRDIQETDYIVTASTKEETVDMLRRYTIDYLFIHEDLPGAVRLETIQKEAAGAVIIQLHGAKGMSAGTPFRESLSEWLSLDDWYRMLTDLFSTDHSSRLPLQPEADMEDLTRREEEVFRLKVQGYSLKESARVLQVSVKTIENHRRSISKKLMLKTNRDWIKRAESEGFFDKQPRGEE